MFNLRENMKLKAGGYVPDSGHGLSRRIDGLEARIAELEKGKAEPESRLCNTCNEKNECYMRTCVFYINTRACYVPETEPEPEPNPKPHLCNTCNERSECDGRNYYISVCDLYKPELEQWKPKGGGMSLVSLNRGLFDKAGHTKARPKVQAYILQLQWLFENYPEQNGEWSEETRHFLYFNSDREAWDISYEPESPNLNQIFMSQEAADHLRRDMNSGKVRF